MSIENDPNKPSTASEKVKAFFHRLWEYLKVAKLELIVLAAFFIVDMVSKALVAGLMKENQTIEVIPYILNFTYKLNEDAAFGNSWLTDWLGPIGSRVAFSIFAVAASVVFFIMMVRGKGGHRLYRVSLAMLIAGAMGNCIDRMFLTGVRDFIDFRLFTLITGGWWRYIFNIADVALVVGVILIIIYFIFFFETEGRKARRDARRAARAAKKAAQAGVVVGEQVSENAVPSDNVTDNVFPIENADTARTADASTENTELVTENSCAAVEESGEQTITEPTVESVQTMQTATENVQTEAPPKKPCAEKAAAKPRTKKTDLDNDGGIA